MEINSGGGLFGRDYQAEIERQREREAHDRWVRSEDEIGAPHYYKPGTGNNKIRGANGGRGIK